MTIDDTNETSDLVELFYNSIEHAKNHNYTPLLNLYNNFQLGKNNYTMKPENRKKHYKIHTIFMNLDKTKNWKNIFHEYIEKKYKADLNKKKSIHEELMLSNKAVISNEFQDYEKNFIIEAVEIIRSEGDISSNAELSYIDNMLNNIQATITNPMGKYSIKFIHSSVKGQSSFFEEGDILDLDIKGVCSRNIARTDEILWDGNANLMKNVKFLFSNIGNTKVINDIANKGEYYNFIHEQLNDEQRVLLDKISNDVKISISKNNESVDIPSNGVASIFFPTEQGQYILLTPVVSGDMQTALNTRNIGKKLTLKRGGANPQNGGWLCQISKGRHVHFYSEMPSTLIQSNDLNTSFISGRPIFVGLKISNKKENDNVVQGLIRQIESIATELSNTNNENSISRRDSEKILSLSYRLGKIILNNFIIFADDYEIKDEKPKRMDSNVYKALTLYAENNPEFYNYVIELLLNELTSSLNDGYINKIFRRGVESGIRSVV